MPELNQTPDATVPAQREAVGPVKKSTPVVIALIAIVALIGIANISSLVSGKKKSAPASALPMRPSASRNLRPRCSNSNRNRLSLVRRRMEHRR
jgi:hypothetical protein